MLKKRTEEPPRANDKNHDKDWISISPHGEAQHPKELHR